MVDDRLADEPAPRGLRRAERWANLDAAEVEGIGHINRIVQAGKSRIWAVAILTAIAMGLPLPWRDDLGKVYGWYALLVLAVGLGVIYVMGARQILAIRREYRAARAQSTQNQAQADGE